MKVAFFIVLAIVLGGLAAGGVYAWTLWNSFNEKTVLDEAFPDDVDRPAAVEGAQTFLLLGSDSRSGADSGDLGDTDQHRDGH